VRDLRRAGTPDRNTQQQEQQQPQQEAPAPNQKNPSKSDNRHGTERQKSSRDNGDPVLAAFPAVMLAAIPQARQRAPKATPSRSYLRAENRRTA